MGEILVVAEGPDPRYDTAIAWSGSEFGVVWADDRDGNWEVYFARLDATGARIGNDHRVTFAAGSSQEPVIEWTGSEYGVAWTDFRDGNGEIYFARLDASGTKIGDDVRVTEDEVGSLTPTLAWTGSEFGIAWTDSGPGSENHLTRLNASGAKLGDSLTITDDPAYSDIPRVSWTGSEYAVFFSDDRNGDWEIYLTRVGCDCIDGDADDFTSCRDCDDSNPDAWSPPSEALDLAFAPDKQTLYWSWPAEPGSPEGLLRYDTLRSDRPDGFLGDAVCIESDDGPNTTSIDPEIPPVTGLFHYLVRAANPCPDGEGSLGPGPDEREREGRHCP